ncbi:hypothetical protein LTS18_001875, partial [Coniosporium uncinatum]
LIASWSGDYIYSFDLVRSPDATFAEAATSSEPAVPSSANGRTKESKDRKRKRPKNPSTLSLDTARAGSRARTESQEPTAAAAEEEEDSALSLMVQYGNGQSEEIPLSGPPPPRIQAQRRSPALQEPDSFHPSFHIARLTVKMRKHLFDPATARKQTDVDPTGHMAGLSPVLAIAASHIEEMEIIMREWRYPVNPSADDVAWQNSLRRDRGRAWRLVQAAGTLARALGARIRTAGGGAAEHPGMRHFFQISPAPNEVYPLNKREQFGYDFLKAIFLWLDSGVGALLGGFTRPTGVLRTSPRFPIPEGEEVGIDAVDEVLVPYLLGLAGEEPVPNVDASRFEVDENQ